MSTFAAINPTTGAALPERFDEGTAADVDRALAAASAAFESYRRKSGAEIADFLDAVATTLENLGDALTARAHEETGLPMPRLVSERGRMLNQVRIFAAIAREGSWVGARIDRGDPGRAPLPKPDVRTQLVGVGPVVVFGASNFPLAISVAGTDTVSALAAGCPVVAKAHPAHPGTSALVGGAIAEAARKANMPPGVFSLVQGAGTQVGMALVRHPATKAVAFTGSLRGGRALFDAAASRPEPIPVFAEMGSVNPVILLPGALAARAPAIAAAFIQSVTMGVGQFCTNPGVVLGLEDRGLEEFLAAVGQGARAFAPATMLHAGIRRAFVDGAARIESTPGVAVVGRSEAAVQADKTQGACVIFATTAANLEARPHLLDEVFGPSSVVVRCPARSDLERLVRGLGGNLTASVHGTDEDLERHRDLVALLETKVGRIIYNGFGTGIEVCAAMNHGGPYPATTYSQFTSIGHASIFRYGRPVCYQGFPQAALPPALRDRNTLGIWRLIDGRLTRDDCQ